MHNIIIKKAMEMGFIGIGFSHPTKPVFFERFKEWISSGKNGDMSWLERNIDVREDPSLLLKDCKTIISLAYPYSACKPSSIDGYTVARYSEPDKEDYHLRLKNLGRELINILSSLYSGCRSRIFVDSAPLLERSYACSAGLGFIGKNNMLIIHGHGSYFYLAEILTTAVIGFPSPTEVKDLCGDCTLCVDSCPTGALERPRGLNASKCLSYRTIESKGAIDRETADRMGTCFLGCDVCQEVCPHNRKTVGKIDIMLPSAGEFLGMEYGEFNERFGMSAFARAGLEKIQENIRGIVLKDSDFKQ